MDSRLLAETLMRMAEINNELKNDVFNEQFRRETAEKGEKEKSEFARKYQAETFALQTQINTWKTKYEALNKELESCKATCTNLKYKLSKKRKQK